MKGARTHWIEGAAKRYVRDLQPGDRVDLEGDAFADPDYIPSGEDAPEGYMGSRFQFEFERVMEVEQETPDCIRVDFESGFSCGFPPDHLVDVDGEQDDGREYD
jgi:hypothetical protein